MCSLIHEIEKSLLRRGPAQALFWQDRAWSFAELDVWSQRMAWGLRAQGITPGDRVAVVVTEPLTADEQWNPLAPGELAVFRDGARMI